MKEKKNMHTLAVTGLFVAAIFWASAYLFVKSTLDTLSPYYLLCFRYCAAAIFMLLISVPKWKYMTREIFKSGMLMGVLLFVEFLTFTVGLKYTTASKSSFIVAGYIVILPLAYILIKRKFPKKQEILAALLCMAGIALILTGGEGGLNKGDLLTVVCAVAYAFHIVVGGIYAKKHDGILLNMLQIGTTAVLATITALISGPAPAGLDRQQIVSILYLAIPSTVIPYLLCLFGQKYVSTTTSGIILSFESVFATLLSILFLHDRISVQFTFGAVLVMASVFVSEWKIPTRLLQNER